MKEIQSLASAGVEIGSHGWTHRCFLDMSIREIESDLSRCLDWFEENLGYKPDFIAYPFGRCDRRRALAVEAHFKNALAVDPLENVDVAFALPRMPALEFDSFDWFSEKLARYALTSRCR
jgi:peptidoglycan/xylan/chitin deacetylase (PgdA/CDA1 family)